MVNWSREIVLAEITGESVGREVAKVLAPPLQAPRVTPIPDPLQSLTVPANETKQVFYFKVPEGMIMYIQLVGNNWFEDTYLYWYIDSRLVISPYINYQIAAVNTPKKIEPWLPVYEEVRWKAENKSDVACLIEIRVDGFYCSLEDVPILLKLGLPCGR